MKKSVKIGFPIFCIVIVGGTLVALSNLQNKANEISNNKSENKIENSVNQIYDNNSNNTVYDYEDNYIKNDENTIENDEKNNTNTENIIENEENTIIKNTTVTNTSNTKTNTTKTEETEEKNNVSDKDKAISMVQAEWGSDSSVYFTSEGVSNGYYIVAVRDKSNTSVKLFYKVNLQENTVEIDW